ncbi:hypothetical protein U0070_018102 [Myodes glareolus]|uniref:Uncharacterized protein n=1 Tax=Myodes glareolus TaxID=447135 RepID=A0AAW0HHJ3_MYOGA
MESTTPLPRDISSVTVTQKPLPLKTLPVDHRVPLVPKDERRVLQPVTCVIQGIQGLTIAHYSRFRRPHLIPPPSTMSLLESQQPPL